MTCHGGVLFGLEGPGLASLGPNLALVRLEPPLKGPNSVKWRPNSIMDRPDLASGPIQPRNSALTQPFSYLFSIFQNVVISKPLELHQQTWLQMTDL